MTSMLSRYKGAGAAVAIAAALTLGACNRQPSNQTQSALALPDLPATLPLAPGEATEPVFAPAAADLRAPRPISAVRLANAGDNYAYAEDAWGFEDSLGYAPPDYGFYYDEVEPWAWQGYDDSLIFAEPLSFGYRYYYYRPGYDYPYFVRDPYYGYGYDDGHLAIVYDSDWDVVPYYDYGPRLGYASSYYWRGRDLYLASRHRHPVIVGNWAARSDGFFDTRRRWSSDRDRHSDWRAFHRQSEDRFDRYWQPERVRRQADSVRYAAWRSEGFRGNAPPRAIPADWTRARWARDERRYAPPVSGFTGNEAQRRMAFAQERSRVVGENRRFAAAEQRGDARIDRARERLNGDRGQGFASNRVGDMRDRRAQRRSEFDRRRDTIVRDRVDRRQAFTEARDRQARGIDRRSEFQQRREARGRDQRFEGRQVANRQRQDRAQAMRQQSVAERRNQPRFEARRERSQPRFQAERRQSQARIERRGFDVQQQRQARREAMQSSRRESRSRIEAQSQRRAEMSQRRQVQRQQRPERQAFSRPHQQPRMERASFNRPERQQRVERQSFSRPERQSFSRPDQGQRMQQVQTARAERQAQRDARRGGRD